MNELTLKFPPLGGVEGFIAESEGYQLLGTLYTPPKDGKKPAALVLHGLPGFEKNYDIAMALRDRGCFALIFHYRGCWGSKGRYSFLGIPDDVRAALTALLRRQDVDPERVWVVGHSMGGFAALASSALDQRIKATISIAAPGDFKTMPPPDETRLTGVVKFLSGVTVKGVVRQWRALGEKYNPVDLVDEISPRPILVIQGEQDAVVPAVQAQEIYRHAKQPKELYMIKGADHVFTKNRRELVEKVCGWAEQKGML